MFDQLRIRKITISLFAVKNKHKATILKNQKTLLKTPKNITRLTKLIYNILIQVLIVSYLLNKLSFSFRKNVLFSRIRTLKLS